MKLSFIDGISGKKYALQEVEGVLHQGRWLLHLTLNDRGLSRIVYNDREIPLPAIGGTSLTLPVWTDRQGKFQLICFDNAGARHAWLLSQPEGSLIPIELSKFIIDFQSRLGSYLDIEGCLPWSSLEDISFFASRELSSSAKWTDVDDAIQHAMPSILYICHRPRRHITTEEALLPVEAVKRITAGTLSHLAGHSEHWLAKTVTGVKPKRLMTEVYEDKYDLYENCALVTLINKLFQYINEKLESISKIEADLIRKKEAEHFATEFNNFRRLRRLEELWKRNEDLQSAIEDIQEVNEQVHNLYDQLIQAIYSPLYRKLSRTQEVVSPLKTTNLFIFDTNYSEVAKLWQIFNANNLKNKDDDEPEGSYESEGYFGFCVTAVLYALKQLDYVPIVGYESIGLLSSATDQGRPIVLSKAGWTIRVTATSAEQKHPAIELHLDNDLNIPDKTITLFPLASLLPKYESSVREVLDSLYHTSIDNDGIHRFFLHLSSVDMLPDDLDPKYIRRSSTMGDNFMNKEEYAAYGGGLIGLFAVSPWDANSIERIGRLLLYHTTGEQLMQLDRSDAVLSYFEASSLPEREQLKRFVKLNRTHIQSAGTSGSRNEMYKKLIGEIPLYERMRFDNIWNNSNSKPLQACPVCDSSNIHSSGGDSYCNECRSQWGARLCSSCYKPVPKLVPGINLEVAITQEPYKKTAIMMENLLGRDMLSPLCESPSHFGSMWVICPHCGDCINATSCKDCTHCNLL